MVSRPSGSAFLLCLCPSSFVLASSEAGRPAPPPHPPTPPSEWCGRLVESEGVPRVSSCEVSSPPSTVFGGRVGREGGGVEPWLLGVWGFSRFFPPGGWSSRILVLADPSPVASSVSAGRDHCSRSREIAESTGDCSCIRSSRLSPSRGQDSREGRRCARSRFQGSRDRSHESLCRSTDCLRSRGQKRLAVTRPAPLLPVCSLDNPGRSLLTAAGTVEWTHALGVTVCSLDD